MLSLVLGSCLLAGAAAAKMPPAPATLWTSGHGFPCYRQPVVVSAGGSRLLAFVEGRCLLRSILARAHSTHIWTIGQRDFLTRLVGRTSFSSPCAPAAPLGAEADHPSEVGGLNLRISEDGQNWGPSKIIYGNAVS